MVRHRSIIVQSLAILALAASFLLPVSLPGAMGMADNSLRKTAAPVSQGCPFIIGQENTSVVKDCHRKQCGKRYLAEYGVTLQFFECGFMVRTSDNCYTSQACPSIIMD
jgi:hypothetical protein